MTLTAALSSIAQSPPPLPVFPGDDGGSVSGSGKTTTTTQDSGVPTPPGDGSGESGGSGSTNEYHYSLFPGPKLTLPAITNGNLYFTLYDQDTSTPCDIWYAQNLNPVLYSSSAPPAIQWTLVAQGVLSQTNYVIPDTFTNMAFFTPASAGDSDDDGLPDGYEKFVTHTDPYNADTGNTGVPDGYKDLAQDGHSNLEKFMSGANPYTFYTPAPPLNLSVNDNHDNTMTLTWAPSSGSVSQYIIMRNVSYSFAEIARVPADQTSYVDRTIPAGTTTLSYEIISVYPGGNSTPSTAQSSNQLPAAAPPIAAIVRGALGKLYLVVANLPKDMAYLRVYPTVGAVSYPQKPSYSIGNKDYKPSLSYSSYTVGPGSFINGAFAIPDLVAPKYGLYTATVEMHLTNGQISARTYTTDWGNKTIPFIDGTAQLKQNRDFLLRAADAANPFQFYTDFAYVGEGAFGMKPGYVYSGFHDPDPNSVGALVNLINEFLPVENNYLFKNFAYSQDKIDPATGNLITGVQSGNPNHLIAIPAPPNGYRFDTYQYVSQNSTSSISPVLSTSESQWIYYHNTDASSAPIGVSTDYSAKRHLDGSVQNIYGLAIQSVRCPVSLPPIQCDPLFPGGSVDAYSGSFFANFATPILTTVNYYFCRPLVYDAFRYDPMPGDADFSTSASSPLLITSPGDTLFAIGGWARQSVNNSTEKSAYLEQYFDKAYTTTNGVRTGTETGLLSPYGEFFPTAPGLMILTTKPDLDQTNRQGECPVYVIGMSVDANNDGAIDESFTGPDWTTAQNPMKFWVNNDYDRSTPDSDDGTSYEDSIEGTGILPDSQYTTDSVPAIPTKRDLEDYTRLCFGGLSDLMNNLPSNYTITLSWRNNSGAGIRLFKAVESDGGTNYLFDDAVATAQTNYVQNPCYGTLMPNGTIDLTAAFRTLGVTEHFIFCGVSAGKDELVLQVNNPLGGLAGEASVYLDLKDIKNMYERWTVGDNPGVAPMQTALLAQENLPASSSAFSYGGSTDPSTPYILYVHGWNMREWEKDRFAERAFKRLYWQGYQGRFGVFHWPTDNGFTGTLDQLFQDPSQKDNFDRSEYQAWQSAAGLRNKLADLNAQYPGHVYVLAHSMGNVVVGQALRLTGNNQLVNTYVASQAAITAHTYDPAIPNYSFNMMLGSLQINFGPETPNIYGNWFTGNNGGGAGHVINFYNANDYALSRNHWQLDQLFKPDILVPGSGTLWKYDYDGLVADPAPWNNFSKSNVSNVKVSFDIVNNLTHRYEVMAFAAQSYTTALGATPGVLHVTGNIDLTRPQNPRIWPTDTSSVPYGAHLWHSAQFRGHNAQMQGYWSELLGVEAFNLK